MFDGHIHYYQGGEGQYCWCEFERTLKGEYCGKRAQLRLDGLLLCEAHAQRLRLEERVAYCRAMLAHIEVWSRAARSRGREDIVELLEIERRKVSAELGHVLLEELERIAPVTLASGNGRDGDGKGAEGGKGDGKGGDGRVIVLWPPLLLLLLLLSFWSIAVL